MVALFAHTFFCAVLTEFLVTSEMQRFHLSCLGILKTKISYLQECQLLKHQVLTINPIQVRPEKYFMLIASNHNIASNNSSWEKFSHILNPWDAVLQTRAKRDLIKFQPYLYLGFNHHMLIIALQSDSKCSNESGHCWPFVNVNPKHRQSFNCMGLIY